MRSPSPPTPKNPPTKHPTAALFMATATALLLASGCRLTTRTAPVEDGHRAPDFELPDHRGGRVSLGDLLADGPAVLVFFRGHW